MKNNKGIFLKQYSVNEKNENLLTLLVPITCSNIPF